MLKGILLVIIATTLVSSCNKKSTCDDYSRYDRSIRFAYLSYKAGNYDIALKNFEEAIHIKPKENVTNNMYLAATAFHLKKNDDAKLALIDAIKKVNCDKGYFRSFSELVPYHNTEEYQDVLSKFDSLLNLYWSNNDLADVERRLDNMIHLDQEVRRNGDGDLMHKTDSTNLVELKEITASHGWQPKGWLILWHQRLSYPDGEIWPYFKNLIEKEIASCKVHPQFWAKFDDFHAIRNYSYQIYGTVPMSYSDYPILDVQKVDSLRANLDMPPLWYMNKIYDWPLPEGYPIPLESAGY